ncbi:MAG TPA: hypothetical protein V6D13_01100 [Halomicronema sp.]
MNKQTIIEVFLTSLAKQEKPLPPKQQKQLNEIGKNLRENSNFDIINIHNFALSYEPLQVIYQMELREVLKAAAERQKSGIGVDLSQDDDEGYTPNDIAILEASDSVNEAKKTKKTSFLGRFFSRFKRSAAG